MKTWEQYVFVRGTCDRQRRFRQKQSDVIATYVASLPRSSNKPRLEAKRCQLNTGKSTFVIGRKNWLFCDTVAGANASANLYSLIETAKANGVEPYAYLRTVFTELPQATSVEEIEALLPAPNDGEDSARVS